MAGGGVSPEEILSTSTNPGWVSNWISPSCSLAQGSTTGFSLNWLAGRCKVCDATGPGVRVKTPLLTCVEFGLFPPRSEGLVSSGKISGCLLGPLVFLFNPLVFFVQELAQGGGDWIGHLH